MNWRSLPCFFIGHTPLYRIDLGGVPTSVKEKAGLAAMVWVECKVVVCARCRTRYPETDAHKRVPELLPYNYEKDGHKWSEELQ